MKYEVQYNVGDGRVRDGQIKQKLEKQYEIGKKFPSQFFDSLNFLDSGD